MKTEPSSEELRRRTLKLHRKNFWRRIRYQTARPFMLVTCLFRAHGLWERDSILHALALGNAKRCKWCNRLILKKEFRGAE